MAGSSAGRARRQATEDGPERGVERHQASEEKSRSVGSDLSPGPRAATDSSMLLITHLPRPQCLYL